MKMKRNPFSTTINVEVALRNMQRLLSCVFNAMIMNLGPRRNLKTAFSL